MSSQSGERRTLRQKRKRAIGAAAATLALLVPPGCGEDDPKPPTEPSAGSWRTWVADPADLRVAPPPPKESAAARREHDEVVAATRKRTAAQERTARYWSQDPAIAPWVERTLELQRARLASKDPPAAARAYAIVNVAIYDALVATWREKYRFKRDAPDNVDALFAAGPEPSYPSEHAAIAGAASSALAYAFPEAPAPRLEQTAEQAARSRVTAGVNYPSDVEAGLDIGRRAAAQAIARAKRDGSDRRWDGERPTGRGYWDPPPGSVAAPVRPGAATWKTWLLESPSALRPPAPPAFGSARFREQAREVVKVTRNLTPQQERVAAIWSGGEGTALPPGLWNQVALAQVRQSNMSTPHAARVFALMNTAMADAGVACWDAKYAYWSPRPENAIRDLGLARDFEPYLETPFFPSYPSGHATFSGAAATVLAHVFPERSDQFRSKAREAALSRLYGGIHFRADNETGLRMGEGIGRLAVERAQRDGAET